MFFARIIRFEVILFLGGLAAIIAYRLLTGGINTQYLLYGKQKDGSMYFSPAQGIGSRGPLLNRRKRFAVVGMETLSA